MLHSNVRVNHCFQFTCSTLQDGLVYITECGPIVSTNSLMSNILLSFLISVTFPDKSQHTQRLSLIGSKKIGLHLEWQLFNINCTAFKTVVPNLYQLMVHQRNYKANVAHSRKSNWKFIFTFENHCSLLLSNSTMVLRITSLLVYYSHLFTRKSEGHPVSFLGHIDEPGSILPQAKKPNVENRKPAFVSTRSDETIIYINKELRVSEWERSFIPNNRRRADTLWKF